MSSSAFTAFPASPAPMSGSAPLIGNLAHFKSPDAQKVSAQIFSALVQIGIDPARASKTSLLVSDAYDYVMHDPQIQSLIAWSSGIKDSSEIWKNGQNIQRATAAIGSTVAASKSAQVVELVKDVRNFRGRSAGAIFAILLERMKTFASSQGIELNDCSIAIAKLSLDIIALGGETLGGPLAWVMAAMQAFSVYGDIKEVVRVCS